MLRIRIIRLSVCVFLWLATLPVSAAAVFEGIQSGSFTHQTTNGTRNQTITLSSAIDPSKSYLIFQSRHNSADPGGSMIRGRIRDANTLEFESVFDSTRTINVQWYIVEYSSGVQVQRGSFNQSNATTNISLTTPVASTNQAFVTWSKTPTRSDSVWSSDDPIAGYLSSSGNVRFRASGGNGNHTVWWQVIEYTDPADISVQTVFTSMTGNQTNRNISISSVDLSRSFVLASFRSGGSGSDIDERMMSAEFNSNNQVRIRREGSGDDLDEVILQVVTLNDGTAVQGGVTRIRAGQSSASDSLSAITVANAIAFGSVQPSSGQAMGRVDYDSNDIIGEGSATLTLASNAITLTRNSTNDDTRIGWFVLDFSSVPTSVPPVLQSANGSCTQLTEVTLQFSEALQQASAETVSNYQLVNAAGNSIAINSATLSPSDTVTLRVAQSLNDLTQYTVTVNNVQDLSGDVIAANSSDVFSLSCGLNCFTDSFPGPGALSSDWYAASRSGSFGIPRVVRNGALRLTDASGNVATVANLLLQFPGAENRVEVEFDYYAYNGSGADGIAVTFSDASVTPVPGSFGGALGYAQRNNGTPGFAGGWLGVGIDEYGNYSANNEGKSGGSGFARDAVALRGSGSGQTGYNFLTGTGTLSPGIDQSGSTPAPAHRYRIVVDHTMGGGEAYVSVERDTGSGYVAIVPSFDIFAVNPSQASVPTNWVVSFTGSTGGATNIHEIENLQVCAAQPISPLSLVDHYHISHSGTGLTCEAESVTVTAHDASHNPVTVASNTPIAIKTTPSVDAVIPSTPVILAGDSSVTFDLSQSTALANIDIDVSDGSATDIDGGGAEDPPISFVDTAFRFYADGSNTSVNPIGTQIAGKASSVGPGSQSLTLRAVQTNTDTGACEAALQGATTINIAYECDDPAACTGSNALSFTGNATVNAQRNNSGASLSYTPVSMQFNANGEAPFRFNYADAGALTLHARVDVAASSPDPAFTLLGSSNAFVVRPFAFEMDVSGQRAADFADDGVLNDSTASNQSWAADANGSVFQTAGQNFNVDVRAVAWQAADDLDNDGVPDSGADLSDNATTSNFGNESSGTTLTFSHALVEPAGGDTGTFTAPALSVGGGSSDFTSGVASATFNWDEVGIIDISATLNNYLGDSAADASVTAQNFGRFIPATLDVSASNGSFAPACGSFSYIGQRFGFDTSPSAQVIARDAGGGVTANYTETGYLKLSPVLVNRSFSNADNTQLGADGATLMSAATDMLAGSGSVSASGSAGIANYVFDAGDTYVYSKNTNSEISPFTASLTIAATSFADSDGVNASVLPSWTPSGIELRYARWTMNNAFGPEVSDLAMVAQVEYLNAAGDYALNTADNCSDLSSAISTAPAGTAGAGSISNITVGAGSSDLSYNAPLLNGSAEFVFSAPFNAASPGLNYTGSIDVSTDLSALDWLRYDWDGTGTLSDPPAVEAMFGQYRGHDRIIYWREVEP